MNDLPQRGSGAGLRGSPLRLAGSALARWWRRQAVSPAWMGFAGLLAALMALPLGTIVVLSFTSRESVWPHLVSTVLPAAIADTMLLLAGVGLLTLLVGTGAAWLVTMYRFPGRGLLDRLLVLPLAMPTYIVAYCYVELLDFSGPVQRALRALFGWHTVQDYWFPEVRTLTGAVLILAAVLYPYVYLSARASFVQQSICVLEVARTLGRTSAGAFWAVALPLSRPALAAGVALALMECLNDFGAVQYLGVSTLTVSIYATWLQRSNLAGAAQIALVALLFVRGAAGRLSGPRAAAASSITPPAATVRSPSPSWRAGEATRRPRCAPCRSSSASWRRSPCSWRRRPRTCPTPSPAASGARPATASPSPGWPPSSP